MTHHAGTQSTQSSHGDYAHNNPSHDIFRPVAARTWCSMPVAKSRFMPVAVIHGIIFITSGARDRARDPTKGDAMKKIALWVILLTVCAGLAAMYIYSDHFGNVSCPAEVILRRIKPCREFFRTLRADILLWGLRNGD